MPTIAISNPKTAKEPKRNALKRRGATCRARICSNARIVSTGTAGFSARISARRLPATPREYSAVRTSNCMQLLVRTAEYSRSVAANLRAEILALNPAVPVDTIRALEQILARQVAPRRFNAFLLGSFAVLGLLIAMVGIYGVISYSVSQRTHEI